MDALGKLTEAVAGVAEAAGLPALAAAFRAALTEQGVFEVAATSVPDESKLALLRAGLADAIVDHASDGIEALRRTGSALEVRDPAVAEQLITSGRTCVVHMDVAALTAFHPDPGPEVPVARAAGRTARASAGLHRLTCQGSLDAVEPAGAMCRDLGACSSLGFLTMQDMNLDGFELSALAASCGAECGLLGISLLNCGVFDDVVAALESFVPLRRSLQLLHLPECALSSTGGASLGRMVEACRELATLSLRGGQIDGDGMLALARGLEASPSLTHLDLDSAPLDTSGLYAIGRVIAESTSLRTLDLSNADLEPRRLCALCPGIAASRGLSTLLLRFGAFDRSGALTLAAAAGNSSTLTELDVGGTRMPAGCAAALAGALCTPHGSLRRLTIGGRFMPGEEAVAAMRAARRCRPGSVLQFRESGFDSACATALLSELQHCPGLHGLELACNGSVTIEPGALGDALARAPWLTSLGLQRAVIPKDGAAALAKGLSPRSGLARVDLSFTSAYPDLAAELVASVARLTGLTDLTLRGNSIGSGAATALLAAALPRWADTLTGLDLQRASLGPEAMVALERGLATCTRLATLCVSLNPLGDVGMCALARVVRALPCLKSLRATGSDAGERGHAALIAAVDGNPAVEEVASFSAGEGAADRSGAMDALMARRQRRRDRGRGRWRRRKQIVLWMRSIGCARSATM